MIDEHAVELVVDKLIPDGKALGRLPDGRVAIFPPAVPGDRVRLSDCSESKGLLRARSLSVVAPSRERVATPCPVAAECGGCDWMMLPIGEQRRHKLSVLQEAFRRTGRIDLSATPPTLASGDAGGYRCRVRLQLEGERVGFYSRRSHRVVEPVTCLVMAPPLQAALGDLRRWVKRRPEAARGVSFVELTLGTDGSVALYVAFDGDADEAAVAAFAELGERFLVRTSRDVATTDPKRQRFQLTNETYLSAVPGTFTQVNWQINRRLVASVVEGARARQVRSFLDLFAGSGNFSLPLMAQGCRGVAVESAVESVEAARAAAREQSLEGGRFVVGDAVREAKRLTTGGAVFDLVIVDPPRAGVRRGLEQVASACSRWLAMCSCNPVSLARDLRRLSDLGFVIESVEAFDMFPHTHHLETLVWLRAPSR